MSKILIIGNVLKDVYLKLDERQNDFETDAQGIDWLNLAFNGGAHTFFQRTSVYGGAAVSLSVLNKLGIDAGILNSQTEIKAGEITWSDDPSDYRYILCHRDQITYFVPNSRKATDWAMPAGTPEWLLVDRSTTVTAKLVEEIKNFLKFAHGTKLAVHAERQTTPAGRTLAKMADLLFLEEEPPVHTDEKIIDKIELDTPKQQLVCHITPRRLSFGEVEESWSLDCTDMMTHLTVYSTIVATILGVVAVGGSPADALLWARLNAENASLDGVLGAEKLQGLAKAELEKRANLRLIARSLMTSGKGVLAADASDRNLAGQFAKFGIPDTSSNRRDYRELILATPNLKNYISGIILSDQLVRREIDDRSLVEYLTTRGIIPGIKADRGLVPLENSDDQYTVGLQNLHNRLLDYYGMGIRFAKWRAAFQVTAKRPSYFAVRQNVVDLATFAKECQLVGLVPVVEVDVLADGDYPIERSAEVTGKILRDLFELLERRKVELSGCLLKCNMIMAGRDAEVASTPAEVGMATGAIFKSVIPRYLAGILLLSGGQDSKVATKNLTAILQNSSYPWPISFAFGRALGEPVLATWKGDNQNTKAAQAALVRHLEANRDALRYGQVDARGSAGQISVLDLS